ncbi:MAG: hypothetical protein KUG81_06625 [Gammaproteobacteria bacterium]|nr:hypothetical protein [Gammaproteobacteria bacterium]
MGWTSVGYQKTTHLKFEEKHVKEFLEDEYVRQGYSFAGIHLYKAKDEYDHNEIYCLMKHLNSSVSFINVILVDIKDNEIYWKDVPESMGPSYSNCPVEFFQWVPKAPTDYAINWRSLCARANVKYKQIIL